MTSYSIQATFENIDPPELIAAALFILQTEGWTINDYNHCSLAATKPTFDNDKATLRIKIIKSDVTIISESNLAEHANQFTVDSLVDGLLKMVSSSSFDQEIIELKHRFFMNNPMNKEDELIKDNTQKKSFLKTVFNFRKNFRVTPSIIILNSLILLAMILVGINPMLPDPSSILKWGGVNKSLVLNGDWWRLFTSCFLHYGLIHLAFNMWALHSIGQFLEQMIGSWRFAFAYIIAGLAGSMNSIIWHDFGAGAGASGAIFGMFGLFLALLTTNILDKGYRTAMLRNVVPMILFNLLIGTAGQIDNAAHLGGLMAGLLCGYLFAWYFKNPRNMAILYISIGLPIIFLVGSGYIIHTKLPDPYTDYQNSMKKISKLEREATELEAKNGFRQSKSVQLWSEAIKEIKQNQKLKLSDDIEERNDRLLFYLEKRRLQTTLFQTNPANMPLINRTNQSLDSILKILKRPTE